jgi:hypothetical protein
MRTGCESRTFTSDPRMRSLGQLEASVEDG